MLFYLFLIFFKTFTSVAWQVLGNGNSWLHGRYMAVKEYSTYQIDLFLLYVSNDLVKFIEGILKQVYYASTNLVSIFVEFFLSMSMKEQKMKVRI